MKKNGLMTKEEANQVYDVLVEHCGALESYRDNFVYCHAEERVGLSGNTEYRIGGKLGFGGKFRTRNHLVFSVDYYSEDKTAQREKIVEETNSALAQLLSQFKIED